MDESKANAFMDFLSDPSQIVKSTKFNIVTSGLQFVALIFFAIVGASIGFRFENFRDILDPNYWAGVVVLLIEQLYAMNIGYDLGRTITINSNKELATTNEQNENIVEGVYDETGEEIIRGLKKDTTYADAALNEIMDEEKIFLVKQRMNDIVLYFESKLDYFNTLEKGFSLKPNKIKVGNIKKYFWKTSTAIAYCELQIRNGNKMLDNQKAILAVPDANVSGFTRHNYSDLVSSQDEKIKGRVSRYHQKNENDMKKKMYGKKVLVKILMSMIGPAILFGVSGGDQTLGLIVYSVFILLVQLANGMKLGSSNAINVVLYNAVNRLKLNQDIKHRIPLIKKRIEEEQELKKIEELKKVAEQQKNQQEEVVDKVKEMSPLPKNLDMLLN